MQAICYAMCFVYLYTDVNQNYEIVGQSEPEGHDYQRWDGPGMGSMVLSTVAGAQNIAVIQSPDASPIQETAYREFSRLTALIMGRAPLQVKENVLDHVRERTTDIVLIGDSALSKQIMRDNNISLDPITGSDGYLIRSVELDGKNYLLILGERAVAALYGVYEYFERFCDVGYFPEGDRILKKEKLPLEKLDIVDRPRFAHRVQHLESRAVNLVQSSYYWNLDQYRHAIDWMAKNKFNMELPMNKRGFATNPSNEANDGAFRYVALERYAMERGFRYLLYHPFDVYPNGEHPDMLLPKEFNRQEDREKYGFHDSVDYYYSSGEGGVMEERIKNALVVHAKDPEAKVFQDMWDLTGLSPTDFANKLPDYVSVGELMVFREPAHIEANYYGGKEWFMVWIPSLFWGETLGGDLKRIVRIMREVAEDPKARKCDGFWPMSEGQYYWNHRLYGFASARLAWNPADWTLDRLIKRYVELRYDLPFRVPMTRAMNQLVEWMANHDPARPMHMQAPRMYSSVGGWAYSENLADYADNPDLRHVLDTGLTLAEQLENDPFFESDLTEIARTYYTQIWASNFLELRRAGREAANAVRGNRSYVTHGLDNVLFDVDFDRKQDESPKFKLKGPWRVENNVLTSDNDSNQYQPKKEEIADGITRLEPQALHPQLIVVDPNSNNYALSIQFQPKQEHGTIVFFVRGNNPQEAITVKFNYGDGQVVVHANGFGDHPQELKQQSFGVYTLSDATWHQAVIQATGSLVKLYIDNELIVNFDHQERRGYIPIELQEKKWDQGGFGIEVHGPGIAIKQLKAWTINPEPPSLLAVTIEDQDKFEEASLRAQKHARLCDTIFEAMNNLLATRPEFSVEKFIRPEYRAIDPEGWLSFSTSVRSNGFLRAYNRTESFEVNERVYRREAQAFSSRVLEQIKSKSTEQVAIGDPKFCQGIHQIWREWVIDPVPSRSKFKGSTTKAVLLGLASIDNLDQN